MISKSDIQQIVVKLYEIVLETCLISPSSADCHPVSGANW